MCLQYFNFNLIDKNKNQYMKIATSYKYNLLDIFILVYNYFTKT